MKHLCRRFVRYAHRESLYTRLLMAGDLRDGTGRSCIDMFGEKTFEDGTGRDGKIMTILVPWVAQDRTVGVIFLDRTGRYSTMTFIS